MNKLLFSIVAFSVAGIFACESDTYKFYKEADLSILQENIIYYTNKVNESLKFHKEEQELKNNNGCKCHLITTIEFYITLSEIYLALYVKNFKPQETKIESKKHLDNAIKYCKGIEQLVPECNKERIKFLAKIFNAIDSTKSIDPKMAA